MSKPKRSTSDTNTSQQSQQSAQQSGTTAGNYENVNEVGFAEVPETEAYKRFMAFEPAKDSSIASRFGNLENQLGATYTNLGGEYSTPGLLGARLRGINQDVAQQRGQAYSDEQFRQNQLKQNQLLAGAQMQQPQFYNKRTFGSTSGSTSGQSSGQMSGTGTSNTVNIEPGKSFLGSLLGGLAQGVGGALPFI